MGGRWTPSLATLRRAVLYRTVLGLLLAAMAVIWGEAPPFDRLRLSDAGLATGIVVAVGLWVLHRLRTGAHPLRLALALSIGDFLAATLLIWLTGPITGPLVFLFPLVVVSTSFLLGPGTSYYAAAVAFVLEGLGFLVMGEVAPAAAIRGLTLNGLLLVALAALSDGLATRLHRHEVRAQRREQDVRTLTALADEVLERADTGLMVADENARLTLTNPRAERFLEPAPASASRSLELAAPELYQLWLGWRRGEREAHGEILSLQDAGDTETPHVLAFRFTPLGADGAGSTLIHLYDITEAREQQREQELNERLAALGRLSANLAHEIRNPLSSIQHAGQLLAEQNADARMTGIIQRESRRLNEWVETLLRHLRPSSGLAQPVALRPVLESTVRLLSIESGMDSSPCFAWEIEPRDLTVCVDEGHLHQVLWNLGVNAIRHGQAGGSSVAEIRGFVSRPGRVRIEVRDQGPGIAPENRERIFEPFYTTAAQGTGLGMGLVRELVEANHGTISVENLPGGGACIAVELPTRCSSKGETQG